ncbi:conserved hypothetical protein [Thermotomaculum hydrothermale]|uniref:YicC-like domain-containing protein n=1 Tax=Thermotomaculum hydrothermale TaxID=981385 RepID=A0A7R6PU26_9BACT|nr:YicC/YloC family endoribonuclease [Thermotomaculum hydrothermale]BBB32682.1 conserved hypothetical protein [Thermotomaculum hydrothermale]
MRSMTGFAEAKREFDGFTVNIVIKSINSKYLDANVKIDDNFQSFENDIISIVKTKVKRGRVSIFITIEFDTSKYPVIVNEEKVKPILEQIEKIQKEFPSFDFNVPLNVFLSQNNGFFENQLTDELKEKIKQAILETLDSILDTFNKSREKEGEFLKKDFKERLNRIEILLEEIEKQRDGFFEKQLEKYRKLIGGLVKEGDENRIMIEAGILADKLDISEELTRLKSHVSVFRETMEEKEKAIGKKLDFILQEMMRESNTIGSKGKDKNISKLVIELKTEIEKIREQVQNIE